MVDMCYPNFVPFTMDEFERNFYMYYWNGLNPSPMIYMKFKPISSNPVQGKDFPHNDFVKKSMRQHNAFHCCFARQDPQKPTPACKLYLNWKLYPFLNHILSVFRFSWFLGGAISVDNQTNGF